MFLNVDSFWKKQVLFGAGDDFFTVDGVATPFAGIRAFYSSSTEHFANRVYQGNSLRLALQLDDGTKPAIYEVDSNHLGHYRLLRRIADGVVAFRRDKLLACHQNGEEIAFAIDGDYRSLRLKNAALYLGQERVGALAIDTNGKQPQLEFALPKGRFRLSPGHISDSALFLELAARTLPVTCKAPSRLVTVLSRALVGGVVLFGLNGWAFGVFDAALLMDYPPVDVLSTLAGIILALWVALRPVFWLVRRFNAGRMVRRRELLGGMDGKDACG